MHIKLQSGRFDHADRLFHSILEAWYSSTHSMNDYRELIPQFFSSTHFLVNSNHYNFGVRSDGNLVNDVILPK
jgi:hypothetical protein